MPVGSTMRICMRGRYDRFAKQPKPQLHAHIQTFQSLACSQGHIFARRFEDVGYSSNRLKGRWCRRPTDLHLYVMYQHVHVCVRIRAYTYCRCVDVCQRCMFESQITMRNEADIKRIASEVRLATYTRLVHAFRISYQYRIWRAQHEHACSIWSTRPGLGS